MHLTNLEKETIITFNEAEKEAEVYTCNKSLMCKLDKFCLESTEVMHVKEDNYSKTYKIPKKWIKINKPPKLSEEERQRRIKLLEKAHEARKQKSNQPE